MIRRPAPFRLLSLYALAIALLCLPVLSVKLPPLLDYPNHIARMYILAHYATHPALQSNYVVAWTLSPYLAMEAIVPTLARFMPVYTAGQVFLCVCLALFVIGTATLNAVLFRRLSAWPAISALFAYNWLFALGFADYLFAIGMWLLAFAGWVVLSRGPAGRRLGLGCLLTLPVFFSHYFALFGYGICVAAFETGAWRASGNRSARALAARLAIAAGTAVIPICVFVASLRDQQAGFIVFGKWSEKVFAVIAPVWLPDNPLSALLLIVMPGVFAAGFATGSLRLSPAMRWPLWALGAAALVMPSVMAAIWGMDYRFPVVLAFLLVAACDWRPRSQRASRAGAAAMLALLAGVAVSIAHSWQASEPEVAEFRAAMAILPRGARILPFRDDNALHKYNNLPALAVIERDAFLPYLFKNPMQHIQAAPALRPIDAETGGPPTSRQLIEAADPVKGPALLGSIGKDGFRNFWGGWPANFDYAIELTRNPNPTTVPHLRLLATGRIFKIYRVVP